MNASHLIEANVKAHTSQGYTAAHMVQAAHEATIRDLCQQLETLTGANATASKDCHLTRVELWGVQVLVEHEHDKGDVEDNWPECFPVCAAFINGQWVKAKDIPEDVREELSESIASVYRDLCDGYVRPNEQPKIDAAESRAEARNAFLTLCPMPVFPSLRAVAL